MLMLMAILLLMWAISSFIEGKDVQGVIASALFMLTTVALVQLVPDKNEEVSCQSHTAHDVEPRTMSQTETR